MRKLFCVVAAGALALGVSGCSQDTLGPDVGPQYGFGWGHIQRDPGTVISTQSPDENLPQCAWEALLSADNQMDKRNCKK